MAEGDSMIDLREEAVTYEAEGMDIEEQLLFLDQAQADFEYWCRMPFWSLDEGLALLLGKDPKFVHWGIIRTYVDYHYSSDLCAEYDRLRTVLLRALEVNEIQERNTPTVFLAWASKRSLQIPEALQEKIAEDHSLRKDPLTPGEKEDTALTDALSPLFEKPTLESDPSAWVCFDETKATYAKELVMAIPAHAAVSQNWQQDRSVKKQLLGWLTTHYPHSSKEAKERIAKICNWQKEGGAPLTPSSS